MERIKNTWKTWLFCLGLLASLAFTGQTEVFADTLTMTIERFSLGGSFILEPEVVEFTPGESYEKVLRRVLEGKGIQYGYTSGSSFYLTGIRGVAPEQPEVPSCVMTILEDYYGIKDNKELTPNDTPDLYEKYYTEGSGWMYYVNNEYVLGMNQVYPSQGDVVRFMYTLALGADLTGCQLNQETMEPGKLYYNTADKSELVRKMGTMNQNRSLWENDRNCMAAYENAVRIMGKMNASEYNVTSALKMLEEALAGLDPSPTGSLEPSPTGNPEPSPTENPEPSPTGSPDPSPTGSPEPSPTESPKPSPTESPEPSPTESPEPSLTGEPDSTPIVLGKASVKKVSSVAYNKLKVTWSQVKGAEGYGLYRSGSGKDNYKLIRELSGGGTLSYTDSGLTPGKTYYYKVCALGSSNGESVKGELSSERKGKPVPAAPSVSVLSGRKKASVKWKKTAGASGYTIYRSTSRNGKYQKVKTVKKGAAGSWTDKKAKPKKRYYYKVRAYSMVSGKKVEGSLSATRMAKVK